MMAMFLISYFALILKDVKGEGEEEFMILREIPTILGRLVVFGAVLFFSQSAYSQQVVFFVPICAILILVGFLVHNQARQKNQL